MSGGGVVTERDYIASQYLHMRPRKTFAILGILILSLFLVVTILSWSWVLVFIAACLAGWYYLLIPWLSRRNYRMYKAMARALTIELTEEGCKITGENSGGTIPWGDFMKLRQSKDLLLLYPADNVFHIVPQHFFETREQFEQFVLNVRRRATNAV